MKVAPLITVALILCIACPGLTQAKKKPKPKFCIGKNGIKYAIGDGYVDEEGEVCIRYICVKKKKKVFMTENKCGPIVDLETRVTKLEAMVEMLKATKCDASQCNAINAALDTKCDATTCSNIHATTTDIGTCMSDLSSLDCPDSAPGKIGVVDGIVTNIIGISNNTVRVISNKADINTNKVGIHTNKADINTNKAVVNTNKADINTNKAGINNNKADVNTNKAGINTNKAGINTNKAVVNTNKADINTNKAGINTNQAVINTNQAGINTNKADIITNKAIINTNKADINTNKAVINTYKAYINTNKAGIMENKAAIAVHHGGPALIYTDAHYQYYKIPVPASSKMTSAVVLTTCIKLGMKPQCYHRTYADSNCVQAPSTSIHGYHPRGMSQILCSTDRPHDCASTLNMFWYMENWVSGSACGATKAGSFCSTGKDYTSTSHMPYFAACLKPVTTDWTIIQRRGQYGNAEDYFYKDFKDYENGFGSDDGELWIGLKNLAALTKDDEWELQVDLTDWDDKKYHAKYATFSVGPAPRYRLHVGGFKDGESTLGDSMDYHDGYAFSARDKDQDQNSGGSCAVSHKGAWWYKRCHEANLNGLNFAEQTDDSRGLMWWHGKSRGNNGKTWKASVMKIKRVEV